MRHLVGVVYVLGILVGAAHGAGQNSQPTPQNEQTAIVITFKDGHQQSFLMADIARIEY